MSDSTDAQTKNNGPSRADLWLRRHGGRVALSLAFVFVASLGTATWVLWHRTFPGRTSTELGSSLIAGDVQTPSESVDLYWTTEPPDHENPRETTLALSLVTSREADPYLVMTGTLEAALRSCRTGFVDDDGQLLPQTSRDIHDLPVSASYVYSALATGGSSGEPATGTLITLPSSYAPEPAGAGVLVYQFTCYFDTRSFWRSTGSELIFDLPVTTSYDGTYAEKRGGQGLGKTHDQSKEHVIVRSTPESYLARAPSNVTQDKELLTWEYQPFELFAFSENSGPKAGGAIWSPKGFAFGSDSRESKLQFTLIALGALLSLLFEAGWILLKHALRAISGAAGWLDEDEVT